MILLNRYKFNLAFGAVTALLSISTSFAGPKLAHSEAIVSMGATREEKFLEDYKRALLGRPRDSILDRLNARALEDQALSALNVHDDRSLVDALVHGLPKVDSPLRAHSECRADILGFSKVREYGEEPRPQELIWMLESTGNFTEAAILKQRLRKTLLGKPVFSTRDAEKILMDETKTSSLEEAFIALAQKYYHRMPTQSEYPEALRAVREGLPPHAKSALALLEEGWRLRFRPNMQPLEFENGVRGIFKSVSPSEVKKSTAAYKIDQLFGLSFVPMIIERTLDGESGTVQYFIPNAESEDAAESMDDRRFRKLRVFDYLTQHGDRTPRKRNFVLTRDGRVVAIDNDGVFATTSVTGFYKEMEEHPSDHAPNARITAGILRPSDHEIREALKDDLSPEDIEGLISRRARFFGRLRSE